MQALNLEKVSGTILYPCAEGGDHEEFIKPEHIAHIAATIPGAGLLILRNVSHFAPLQAPSQFNAAVLQFLDGGAARD